MDKDNELTDGQEGQDKPAEVVEQRRRRAPGVVIGDEANEAAVPAPAAEKSEEHAEPKQEAVNAPDPATVKPERKRRVSANKEDASERPESAGAAEPAAGPESSSGAEGDASEGQPRAETKDAEPARKRRRSRRSGGAKAAGEEPVAPDLGDLDPEELSAKSWELFSREVQENGMEIVDDREARKFAVRSVEIARIYLQERARLIPGGK